MATGRAAPPPNPPVPQTPRVIFSIPLPYPSSFLFFFLLPLGFSLSHCFPSLICPYFPPTVSPSTLHSPRNLPPPVSSLVSLISHPSDPLSSPHRLSPHGFLEFVSFSMVPVPNSLLCFPISHFSTFPFLALSWVSLPADCYSFPSSWRILNTKPVGVFFLASLCAFNHWHTAFDCFTN